MQAYVLDFQEIDRTRIGEVGGKGASLGALARLEGVRVPDGFCVSTAAFVRATEEASSLGRLRDRLAALTVDDRDGIRACSAEIREVIEGIAIPDDVRGAVTRALGRLGAQDAYAVRSSATAEDLPTASFAGQQDTYLNVIGEAEILRHISRCWASLFTERAVAYRIRHGFDHRKVHMAVVVQRLIVSQAAGILFTADPMTSNRKVSSIEAVFGLGEALVSGRVPADGYRVRAGQIVETTRATKTQATRALEGGGTTEQALTAEQRSQPVLTVAQIERLARLGRRIEAHFGQPQDIEWCLHGDDLYIVQSRPITTLYPVPEAGKPGNRVFISVGHQQMMTDPMRPLGLSLFQLIAARPMYAAGGRLFVDPTEQLASPASRNLVLGGLSRSDPLIGDALSTILERDDFITRLPAAPTAPGPGRGGPGLPPAPLDDDPAIVAGLIQRSEASVAALKLALQARSGVALLDLILEDVQVLKASITEPQSFRAIMAGISAASWLNEQLLAWLGEKNAADTLSQSAPGNITAEMGLALLDVADAIRPHPEVVAYLHHAEDAGFWEGLAPLAGGEQAHEALSAWLDRYGMRCAGEIDVTRTRWRERPTMLVPLILSNIKTFPPGAARRRLAQGQQAAAEKEQALLARLQQLPDGAQKAAETQQMIRRLRTFIGYREYPKYGIICRFFVYRQALQGEAERLVQARVIREVEDIDFLSLPELREVVRTQMLDEVLLHQRRAEHTRNQRLTPPRVITSDGEVVTGTYRRDGLPEGALVGLGVSAGVVEGRARVLRDMADAVLEAGDILVTPFTDPGWTPLFVGIRGLVTEVGGLMTHGAVIAREYGLPAVVGVEQATRRIRDGQRIRVHGTEGYVEILA